MNETPPRLNPFRLVLVGTPLVLALLIFLSVGLFALLTSLGGTARGERARITVRSACAPQWSSLLLARAQKLGLGEPSVATSGEEAQLTATLPGLEDDAQAVPQLLSAPGVFAVYGAPSADSAPSGSPLATQADVEEVYLQLDVSGHPYAEVHLQPLAAGRLQSAGQPVLLFLLDGALVDTYEGPDPLAGPLELHPALDTTRDEVRRVSDWIVLLSTGPAPCPAEQVLLTPAAP